MLSIVNVSVEIGFDASDAPLTSRYARVLKVDALISCWERHHRLMSVAHLRHQSETVCISPLIAVLAIICERPG